MAALGKTFDVVAAEHEEQGIPFKWAERKSRKEKKRQEQEKDAEEGVAGPGPAGVSTPRENAEDRSSKDDGPGREVGPGEDMETS